MNSSILVGNEYLILTQPLGEKLGAKHLEAQAMQGKSCYFVCIFTPYVVHCSSPI